MSENEEKRRILLVQDENILNVSQLNLLAICTFETANHWTLIGMIIKCLPVLNGEQ